MVKQVGTYIFIFLLGAGIGGYTLFRITERTYIRKIVELSGIIESSRNTNRELQEANRVLGELYSGVTERVERLTQELNESNRRYNKQITAIKGTIGEVSKGLTASGTTIRDVANGIGEIANIIQSLPDF